VAAARGRKVVDARRRRRGRRRGRGRWRGRERRRGRRREAPEHVGVHGLRAANPNGRWCAERGCDEAGRCRPARPEAPGSKRPSGAPSWKSAA